MVIIHCSRSTAIREIRFYRLLHALLFARVKRDNGGLREALHVV